jgi:hypothetical protein
MTQQAVTEVAAQDQATRRPVPGLTWIARRLDERVAVRPGFGNGQLARVRPGPRHPGKFTDDYRTDSGMTTMARPSAGTGQGCLAGFLVK